MKITNLDKSNNRIKKFMSVKKILFEVKNKKHHQLDFDAKKERRQFI